MERRHEEVGMRWRILYSVETRRNALASAARNDEGGE